MKMNCPYCEKTKDVTPDDDVIICCECRSISRVKGDALVAMNVHEYDALDAHDEALRALITA